MSYTRSPQTQVILYVLLVCLLFLLFPTGGVHAEASMSKKNKASDWLGNTIQFDPSFKYYQDRSPDSIADEFLQNGFKTVRYFVVNENHVNRELVEALKRRGLTVWALVLGNGSYSVEGFPAVWPSWQMELLTPVNDGYYRFSPHSPGYVEWKKQKLVKLVRDYPFDGIEVAEPYFPEWDGIRRGVYGDVGPLALAAFKKEYGYTTIPNFTDPAHPDYYLTNREKYEDWVEFRVDTVNEFLDELINGDGGVRDARRNILVATWSLAIDAGPNSVETLREIQGLDAAEMISAVKPDVHILQTHWPDWMKPQADLPPTYIKRYQNFVDQIRFVHPDIPLGVQADIGSGLWMVKDRNWFNSFAQTAQEMGLRTWTAYEYHLGRYIYDEAPRPVHITRSGHDSVVISFQKRIDEASSKLPGSLTILAEDGERVLAPDHISVDGNMLIIRSADLPKKEFKLRVNHIADTPSYWLYNKSQAPNVIAADTVIEVGKKNH